MSSSIVSRSDSYKYSHWKQYPPGTQHVFSYLESRGGQFPETVFFGLQYYLRKYLAGVRVDRVTLYNERRRIEAHMGPGIFNESGWQRIVEVHGGLLPLRIRAVPEGTVVKTSNVLMTIENTDPHLPWLTNFVETMLVKLWYPITVATLSRAIRHNITAALQQSGDPGLIDFKLHDFGYRGVSSEESAAIGGAAHLINFKGSDTMAALTLIQKYYDGSPAEGFSIPASEHSTITSWGRDAELAAFDNMLTQYPEGMVACVSDSYDIYNACRNLWGSALREKIRNRNGVLIVRPDSGDPVSVVLKCHEILGEQFGYEMNSKGYKVLSPRVRVIQGDGVNYHSINAIMRALMDRGWSIDNVAFGMGGALLQQLNRDTQKFAFKCSNVTVDGEQREVYKDPVTDPGKVSKTGRLLLVDMGPPRGLVTVRRRPELSYPDDVLETVFENGEVLRTHTFAEIRDRVVATGEHTDTVEVASAFPFNK